MARPDRVQASVVTPEVQPFGSLRPIASVATATTLLGADLASKALAERIDDLALVDPVANDELMLGLADLPVALLIVVSSLMIAAGCLGAGALIRQRRIAWWVLPLGVAGFLGNVIDRVATGDVRDWLVVGPMRWNLADFFLLVAIVLVVAAGISSVRTGRPDRSDETREEVRQR